MTKEEFHAYAAEMARQLRDPNLSHAERRQLRRDLHTLQGKRP